MLPICCSCFDAKVTPQALIHVKRAELTLFVLGLISIALTIYFRNVGSWAAPTLGSVTGLLFICVFLLERKRRAHVQPVTAESLRDAIASGKSDHFMTNFQQANPTEKQKTLYTLATNGGNLLHILAEHHFKDDGVIQNMIIFFKKENINISAPEKQGKKRTPLHIAYQKNNTVVIKALIEHGADQAIGDAKRNIPSFYAKLNDQNEEK